jgi:pimeloyl-ACP methyl ester carboxylesterase
MRRGRAIAASLIVIAAAAPASGAAAPSASGATATASSAAALARLPRCADDRSARCGSIRVPVYRGVSGSGRFTVRFRVYLRTDRSRPALEPIVTVEGGPGYPSIGSADYYLFMLGRLRARHDVIVMDNRGTGSSGAINCPRLQEGKGIYAREVGRCARKLGRRANAYGTGAAADDLAALLDRLRVPVVDVYGDSYGTYFAQSFAVRHPQRVRAVVLDAAFGVDDFDFWTRQESRALRFAWPTVCTRSTGCGADVLDQLNRWAVRLEARPIRGTSRDADGGRHRVKLDGANLGQMAGDASYYYSLYRDLSAALSAAGRGDRAPLLRLAAEDLPFTGGGPVKDYSEGAYAAVACHDYPVVWDTAAPLATRRAQLAAARATLAPDAFAPFPSEIWLRSLYVNQLVTGCLRWPAPAHADPPVPPGATYPSLPVLVLVGDIDAITPLEDSQRAASLFPNSTLVTVSNVNHVTALADFNGCASGIVRRFLRTLSPGDTSCAARVPEVHVVPEFPRRLAEAPAATPTPGDRSTARDRRVAWAAAWTAGDALARWWLMYGEDGHGLRGGSFVASGDYLAYVPIRLRLRATRFVENLPVGGTLTWDRRKRRVTARLRVKGGTLRVAWSATATRAIASVRGTLGGRAVRLETPAP